MSKSIISKKEKDALSIACLPIIKDYLVKKNKNQIHIEDAINSIDIILEKNSVFSKHAFFILFATNIEFQHLRSEVLKGNKNYDNIKNPDYWTQGKISLDVAIFFVCTYYFEIFSEQLEKDFKKTESIETVEEYIKFRNTYLNS